MAKTNVQKRYDRRGYTHYRYTDSPADRQNNFLDKASKLKGEVENYNYSVDKYNKTHKRKKKYRNFGEEYYNLGIQMVSNNELTQRDLIMVFDVKNLQYNKYKAKPFEKYKENVKGITKEYRESIKRTYNIDQEKMSAKKYKTQEIKYLKSVVGLTDEEIAKKNAQAIKYYNEEVLPFKRKRNRYIDIGLYEQMRWDLYVSNYKKALDKAGFLDEDNREKVFNMLDSLKSSEREEFIKRSPEINSFYHDESVEDVESEYHESLEHVIRSIWSKRRKRG